MYPTLAILVLVLPFAASLATFLWGTGRRRRSTALMLGTAVACLALALALLPAVRAGAVVRGAWTWAPMLGLDFSLRVDGLAWLFMLLITGIGVLVGLYAHYYMPPEYPLRRLFALLLGFMGSMLGIVMAGNLILLVMFWELTSLFSFLLIGYWHHGESARDGARTALIVTGGGGLALFAGVLLLGHLAGSYDLDRVLAAGPAIRQSPWYPATLLLICTGAFAKSALFPFHFWLPHAMSAPTPVSAYLHSATMVKAGLFLLLRLSPVLGGTPAWFWLLGGAGLVSLVLGAWAASLQQDLKAILAYSTVSHLGLIAMLLGMGGALGTIAAIFHIINHATFKASLFMAAGAIDGETGTRDLRRLGGLWHVMPITATLALVASAAMAGVPLLNGFLSKEMFLAVALDAHHSLGVDAVVAALAVIATALGVTYSIRLVWGAFAGPRRHDYPRAPGEPPLWMRFPIGFLALACLAVGIFPERSIGTILRTAAVAVLGAGLPAYSLTPWHAGLSAPLALSGLAFAGGSVIYLATRRWLARRAPRPLVLRVSAKHAFDVGLAFVTGTLPRWQQRVFPERHLQPQLRVMLVVAVVAVAAALDGWPRAITAPGAANLPLTLLWIIGAACALAAAGLAKFHRLAAVVLTGAVGLCVCLTFVALKAPDLAVTQLVVDAMTTVLLLLGLRWLPKRRPAADPARGALRLRHLRDLLIAGAAGAGVAVLAWHAMLAEPPTALAQFFTGHAQASGGRNVVNVILVDFRGFDTLGEITVLAVVALAIFALLRRFRPAPESLARPAPRSAGVPAGNAPLPDALAVPARLMLLSVPLLALLALHLFLRGHNLPGGGFVAGVTATLALIVLYMARGARWVEARLRVAPTRWIGAGLLLALATGGTAMVLGRPFLTTWHDTLALGVLGRVELASAVLFDLGVLLVVLGATSLILVVLAHQAIRSPLPPRAASEAKGLAPWN